MSSHSFSIFPFKERRKLCGIERDSLSENFLFPSLPTNPFPPPFFQVHTHSKVVLQSRRRAAAMANMIMASSKALITSSSCSCTSSSATPPPKIKVLSPTQISFPKLPLPNLPKPHQLLSHPISLPVILAAASLSMAPPSLAVEIEKAQLFDFNLTLPIIMGEFLLLVVALDKIYFSPLGKFMDDRDAEIREKLSSVKDTSEEVKQLEEQAAAILKAARAEIAAALNKMKKETQQELEQKLLEERTKVEAELQEALANLEKEKEETVNALDSQIAALSDEIVKKVLPVS